MSFFEVRAVYERTLENGQTAKVKEDYLVEAETVTIAEAIAIEKIGPDVHGEFEIVSVKKRKVAEIFEEEDQKETLWYQAKVNFVTLDEKTGTEKKTTQTMMVKAADLAHALQTLSEGMAGTMSDWEAASIAESTIVELYRSESTNQETQPDGETDGNGEAD